MYQLVYTYVFFWKCRRACLCRGKIWNSFIDCADLKCLQQRWVVQIVVFNTTFFTTSAKVEQELAYFELILLSFRWSEGECAQSLPSKKFCTTYLLHAIFFFFFGNVRCSSHFTTVFTWQYFILLCGIIIAATRLIYHCCIEASLSKICYRKNPFIWVQYAFWIFRI